MKDALHSLNPYRSQGFGHAMCTTLQAIFYSKRHPF